MSPLLAGFLVFIVHLAVMGLAVFAYLSYGIGGNQRKRSLSSLCLFACIVVGFFIAVVSLGATGLIGSGLAVVVILVFLAPIFFK